MQEVILLTDGYKLGHRNQYPKGTEYVYSNWTPRSAKWLTGADDGAVMFGLQYLIKHYLIEEFHDKFFAKPKEQAVDEFKRRVGCFLGPDNNVGTEHIEELHDLGYLPILIKALPEGSVCPIRVPMITVVNTLPHFFWLTNYLETLFSSMLWLPMTSATSARLAKKELMRHAQKTHFPADVDLGFLCHDFSMRGMAGIEAAILSGMGHLTAFHGSETIPAIEALEEYYSADAERELIAGTVPATEHSVMCAGGMADEFETFKRLLTEVYPKGFLSVVSDTWDYWQVVTNYVPRLREVVLQRDGRLVIRPDSGDPVKIICGWTSNELAALSSEERAKLPAYEIAGTYELLWEFFGGTETDNGYKVLDPHIGMIYGDAITLERQKEIYRRLEDKGFAATNIVLGFGSFTYQYKSRDSLGFAMKATWCQINGEPHDIFKSPKTDSGTKNSLKGLIHVGLDERNRYVVTDGVSKHDEECGYLQPVFRDGELLQEYTLEEVRRNLDKSIHDSFIYDW